MLIEEKIIVMKKIIWMRKNKYNLYVLINKQNKIEEDETLD